MLADYPPLNGKYTVIGKVISGMKNVDAIKKGDQAQNGAVTDPDRMLKVVIGAGK
jgi:cyclophilin family peptidyl-prolyl cis-trans isomerase